MMNIADELRECIEANKTPSQNLMKRAAAEIDQLLIAKADRLDRFLGGLDELKTIKESQKKQPDGYGYIYENLIEICRAIFDGEWNLDSLKNAEEGAFWMLAHICSNLLHEQAIAIGDTISITLFPEECDVLLGFDLKPLMLARLESLDDEDEQTKMLKFWRDLIDQIENETVKKLERANKT